MATLQRFEDLDVWKRARVLAKLVYRYTSQPSFNKDVHLRHQMRNCAVSIMGNIAEGFTRNSDKEFRQFLFVAKSSAAELQSHCYIALDQNAILTAEFSELYEAIDHTSRMLSNLIKYLTGSLPTRETQRRVVASIESLRQGITTRREEEQ